MNSSDFPQLSWRKSGHSDEQGGTCVEVATTWHTSDPRGDQAGAGAEPSPGRTTIPGARPRTPMNARRAAPPIPSPSPNGHGGGYDDVRPDATAGPAGRRVLVRDSKDPGGAVLSFTGAAWSVFAHDLGRGRYDLVRQAAPARTAGPDDPAAGRREAVDEFIISRKPAKP